MGKRRWQRPPLERSPVLSYLPHHLYFSPLLYFSLLYFLLSLFAFACKGRWLEPLIILTSDQTLFPLTSFTLVSTFLLSCSTVFLHSSLSQLLPTAETQRHLFTRRPTPNCCQPIFYNTRIFYQFDSITGRVPYLNVNYFIATSATYFGLVLFKLFLLNFVVLILFFCQYMHGVYSILFFF